MFFQVHVFMPSEDRNGVVQYSADVQSQFLDKFDDPYKRSDGDLSITRRTFPLSRPDLIMQVMEEIIEQLSGGYHTGGGHEQTADHKATPDPRARTLKRPALSEVASNVFTTALTTQKRQRRSIASERTSGSLLIH